MHRRELELLLADLEKLEDPPVQRKFVNLG